MKIEEQTTERQLIELATCLRQAEVLLDDAAVRRELATSKGKPALRGLCLRLLTMMTTAAGLGVNHTKEAAEPASDEPNRYKVALPSGLC